ILPPPNLVALPIATENDVQIAVAVDVADGAARFDRQVILLDHVLIPAHVSSSIPNQSRSLLAEPENEVIDAIAVEIADDSSRLLGRTAGRNRQIASFAR